ncbi:hypothetical protein ACQPZF_12125 [Actinosynnema sp. CS-041913]
MYPGNNRRTAAGDQVDAVGRDEVSPSRRLRGRGVLRGGGV